MAKRPFDTGIWSKPWFRKLLPVQKVGWFYLLHHCDYVGVWDADFDAADFVIGAKVDWEALKNECNGNIEVLESGKWWIIDYCKFNYGDINALSKSSLQKAVYSRLMDRGLWGKYLDMRESRVAVPYSNPIRRVKSNSNSKRNKEKELEFETFWTSYPRHVNRAGARKAWDARLKDAGSDTAALVTEIMSGVAGYVRAVAGKDMEYVMHPATFLGPGKRWKDYLVTGPKYVPTGKETGSATWTCTMCGKEYPKATASYIGGVCKACKEAAG